MTAERFTVDSDGKYWDTVSKKYVTITHLFYLVEKLEKENEQLKRKNTKWILDYNGLNTEYEWLKEETEWLKKFKSKVIDLIDEKIKEYKEYDGVDTESYYIGTGLLKELKEELRE